MRNVNYIKVKSSFVQFRGLVSDPVSLWMTAGPPHSILCSGSCFVEDACILLLTPFFCKQPRFSCGGTLQLKYIAVFFSHPFLSIFIYLVIQSVPSFLFFFLRKRCIISDEVFTHFNRKHHHDFIKAT